MPYINVNDVYIMDNTGKQVDDAVDYALANSNRNLLDNPWFTVRQRGVGPFTSGYTVDRWKVSGGTPTITPRSPYGINISASSAFAFDEFTGIDSAALLGKTVTLSALIGGVVYSGTGTYTSSTSININVQAGGISVRLVYDANHPQIRIYGAGTNNVDLDAVKLELGSYSTLANDVPPDYQEELAKCQYYFRRIKCTTETYAAFGYAVAATSFRVTFPYTMRIRPSISTGGTLKAYYAGGNSLITAWTLGGEINDILQIGFTTTGLTPGSVVALSMASGAYIDLSADF